MSRIQRIEVRNKVLGDGITKICIPVTAVNREIMRAQVQQILSGPCDLIEWRVDYYQETEGPCWLEETLTYLRNLIGDIPLIFTIRTAEEGGELCISKEQYQEWNVRAAVSGFADFIDVEINRGEELLQELCGKIHAAGKKVIASFHDFGKTPEKRELLRILCRMQELGADVTKAAVMPQSDRDVLTLLDAALEMKETYADRPFITMSMSVRGGISRLCGNLTGSALTFATAGRASAPGQIEADLVQKVQARLQ